MNYIVAVEGQNIPVPEEIGASDDAVKRALTPFYPEVANAMITRVEKDGTVTVNVIKKAGSKGGGSPLDFLSACPGGQNPAIALYQEIQGEDDLDPYTMLELDARIEAAIEAGEKQGQHVRAALKRLAQSPARPAGCVAVGF